MASSKIGELFWEIKADNTKFDKELKNSEKDAKSFGTKLTSLGKVAAAGFASAIAVGVLNVSKELVSAASDAEETGNKFDVVFQDVSDAAADAAKSLSENFGLSSTASKALLSDTGDLLTGFGFTGEAALDLSTQVNELAVDLASFTNFAGGSKGASEALTKALLGERESVKALGISILDADVKAKVLEMTQQGLTFETERQAKAYATMQIALEQSKNAQGDFERSSDSMANQQRIAAAAVDDLKVALGQNLLPAATEATRIFGELTRSFSDYITSLNETATASDNIYRALSGQSSDLGKAVEDQKAKIEEVIEASENDRTALMKLARQYDFNIRKVDEYIAFIEDEFAGTNQGKIDQLNEEIALIEQNIDKYGGLHEQQKELIRLKKEEISELDGSADAAKEAADAKVAAEQAYESAYRETSRAILANNEEIQESNNSVLTSLKEDADEAVITWKDVSDILTNNVATGLEAVGAAIVNGESAWDAIANAALSALSEIVSALGDQLAAQAALLYAEAFFTGGATLPSAIAASIASAAAYVAAGGIAANAAKFEDGGIVGGSSFSGDQIPARVNSGEMILNRDQQTQLFNMANGSSGGSQQIVVNLDSKPILEAVTRGSKNGKVIIDSRSVK